MIEHGIMVINVHTSEGGGPWRYSIVCVCGFETDKEDCNTSAKAQALHDEHIAEMMRPEEIG